ncbi:MAG: LD-carboxypeptidase [Planctomycetes bacterium]|nr:LD-carboxypeptidase [Planctomycetota bacterium]
MPTSVALWCPAYPLPPARQSAALAAATAFVHGIAGELTVSAGNSPWLGDGAWAPAPQRRSAFRHVLGHDLLLAGRGGYGCLDLLDEVAGHSGPLPGLIGYSDLTVLHAAWAVRGGPETLYGFMPGVAHGDRALASAIALALGKEQHWDNTVLPEARVLRQGEARGPLFAGCLRVLAGLIGTKWMPDLRGRILAIEDIDERPYRIDRDLQQLHLAGCLAGVLAVVANAFPATLPEGYRGPSGADIVSAWAERLAVPAIMDLPFGHHADPLTLACGRATTLRAGQNTWSLEQAVR